MGASTSCAKPRDARRRRGVSVVRRNVSRGAAVFQPLLDLGLAEPDGAALAAVEAEPGQLALLEVVEHGRDLEADQVGDFARLQEPLSVHVQFGSPRPYISQTGSTPSAFANRNTMSSRGAATRPVSYCRSVVSDV